MKTRLKKILLRSLAAVAVLIAGFVTVVFVRENRTFDAPSAGEIKISTDPAVIERGRYLAYGPAQCVGCHGNKEAAANPDDPSTIPLTGGTAFHLPVGTVYTPNLTPDSETGIGRLRDEDIVRMLRYGVRPDGRATLPFMPFANISEEDMTAILSFLRSQPPVKHAVPQHDVNFLGRAVKAFILEPTGPTGPIVKSVPVGPTVEYGRYMANNVADCHGCHTDRNLMTGAFIGPDFAGGPQLDSHDKPGAKFVPPNLTPDPETGRITTWTEDAFVARFKSGAVLVEGSPMPWKSFGGMHDDELRAIYRYLRSLPPVKRATPRAGT